jgi:hypothetical protein
LVKKNLFYLVIFGIKGHLHGFNQGILTDGEGSAPLTSLY